MNQKISSDTTLSSLQETLSLPSTPSISQISPILFPLDFTIFKYFNKIISNYGLKSQSDLIILFNTLFP